MDEGGDGDRGGGGGMKCGVMGVGTGVPTLSLDLQQLVSCFYRAKRNQRWKGRTDWAVGQWSRSIGAKVWGNGGGEYMHSKNCTICTQLLCIS